MKISGTFHVALCWALLAFAGPSAAASISLSGTVVKLDGTGLPGVVVRLSRSGLSTTTNAQGAWTFASGPVGVETIGVPTSSNAGQLRLKHEGGHLLLRVGGRDVSGRGSMEAVDRLTPGSGAFGASRRSIFSPDTVTYSYNQKVFLRDTLSNLDTTGILRVYDTTWNASILYGELKDSRDDLKYRVVRVGAQTWMAENLNYAGPVDTAGSCYYNSADSCARYGRLYRWAAAMGLHDSCNYKQCTSAGSAPIRGICPVGWHLPSLAEWLVLTDTALAYAASGTELKSITGWKTDNGVDAIGFRALPGGYRTAAGSYYLAGGDGYWWTTSENEPGNAWYRSIHHANTIVNQGFNARATRLSVRCVRD